MRVQHLHVTVAGALALALGACGGGGGVNSTPFAPTPTPTPSPTPTPTPTPTGLTVIEAATSSQQFAGKGGTIELRPGAQPAVSVADSEQIRIRYDAATKTYQVQLPGEEWRSLRLDTANGADDLLTTGGPDHTFLALIEFADTGYKYSALARWNRASDGLHGGIAFGIPTPAGAVPVSGNATYLGTIAGYSTETDFDHLAGVDVPGWIDGSITLIFNFGEGTLAGSIEPTVWTYAYQADLPTLNFINTVYSTGSTTFSGQFDTSLAGANAFSGQFTGPAAQELIGSFLFPYKSPNDGNTYQATGAFVGQ